MEHSQRYDRMEEFVDVCKKLWASVDADAFVWDAATGLVADPTKVRAINHVGRFFKVKGPLSVPPSPQGRPVLIQAGGSARGIRAAAKFVDHVFGAGKGIPLMAEQRAHLDAALQAEGRDPREVGIIWATKVVVAETEDAAARIKQRLIADVPPEAVGVWLSHNTGFDMSTLPPRFSLRELRFQESRAGPTLWKHGSTHRRFVSGRRGAVRSAGAVCGTPGRGKDGSWAETVRSARWPYFRRSCGGPGRPPG